MRWRRFCDVNYYVNMMKIRRGIFATTPYQCELIPQIPTQRWQSVIDMKSIHLPYHKIQQQQKHSGE